MAGPYLRISGPETLVFPDGTFVRTREEYLAWHLVHLQEKGVVRRWWSIGLVQAFIEQGRWLALCSLCQTGMLTRPDWQLACCGACGAVHENVSFPADYQQIASALLERPVRETQGWRPPETLDDILRENTLHADEIHLFSRLLKEDA